MEILVSVIMITYNHESFISKAIEGVLLQKTSFTYELIISDDFSTDNNQAIISDYANKYPQTIKAILRKQNLGASINWIYAASLSKGKYIALCEGDDYWTDPLKLQKQVDFLENNEEYSICHHNVEVVYEDNRNSHYSNPIEQKEISTIEDLAQGNYIYTTSCVFRNGLIKEFPEWFFKLELSDYSLHMLNAQFGKIKYLKDVMGSYRIHKGGVWGGLNNIDMIPRWCKMLNSLIGNFNTNVNERLINQQIELLDIYLYHQQDNISKLDFFPKSYAFILQENRNKENVVRKYNNLRNTWWAKTYICLGKIFIKR